MNGNCEPFPIRDDVNFLNMVIPPLRVLFDRSAFHGSRFRRLQESRLRELCLRGRIKVFHTLIFLEETLATHGSRKRATGWRDHLRFGLDVCNGGIFRVSEDIWWEELVVGRGTLAARLHPERRNKKCVSRPELVSQLREVANTGEFSDQWSDTAAGRLLNRHRLQSQRRILVGARQNPADARKELGFTGSLNDFSFEQLRDRYFIQLGKGLMYLVGARRSAPIADQWARWPQRYPHYSAYIESIVYTFYHAMCRPNEGIDTNASVDCELLSYLTWADIVVSNDERFFAQVFKEIWKPRGKRLMTAERFAEFTDKL